MKNLLKIAFPFALLLLIALAAIAQEQPSAAFALETEKQKQKDAPVEVLLPNGTLIEVQLDAKLQSNQIQAGSWIPFIVAHDVKVDNVIVIEKGAHARGRILKARKAGRWGKAGEIIWEIKDAIAVDGTRIALQLTQKEKATGDTEHAPMAVKVGGGVAIGALVGLGLGPAGLLYAVPFIVRGGLEKGSDAVLPAGLLFETKVIGDAKVKVAKNEPPKKQTDEVRAGEKIATAKLPVE